MSLNWRARFTQRHVVYWRICSFGSNYKLYLWDTTNLKLGLKNLKENIYCFDEAGKIHWNVDSNYRTISIFISSHRPKEKKKSSRNVWFRRRGNRNESSGSSPLLQTCGCLKFAMRCSQSLSLMQKAEICFLSVLQTWRRPFPPYR